MKIKCFGIAKDILDRDILEITNSENLKTVADLREYLSHQYPAFDKYKSYMVAVNLAYANDNTMLTDDDEIAIIPPVSGG